MLTTQTESNRLESTPNGLFNTTAFIPELNVKKNRTEYLFKYLSDPTQLAINAAKNGDINVLKLIMDPAPLDDEEASLHRQLISLIWKKPALERLKVIRKIQISILSDAIQKYKELFYHHIDEIEAELYAKLHQQLYEFRLENRSFLAKWIFQKITFNGEDHVIDLKTIVEIHKQFSLKLANEFKNAEMRSGDTNVSPENTHAQISRNPRVALQQYKELIKELGEIPDRITSLEKEYLSIINQIRIKNEVRKKKVETHQIEKSTILIEIYSDASFQKLPRQERDRLKEIDHLKIDLHYRHPVTGNNLIHIAAEAGHFSTALFLMENAVSHTTKNSKNIPAFDIQNNNGDTLTHYLVKKGDLDMACRFIKEGANTNLVNSRSQTVLDIIGPGGSVISYILDKINYKKNEQEFLAIFFKLASNGLRLSTLFIKNDEAQAIHFVINKIHETKCDQKYVDVLLKLISNGMALSTLLIKDAEKQTVHQKILRLQDDKIVKRIFDALKKTTHNQKFCSKFQADINAALWLHFQSLSKVNRGWLKKWISNVQKESIQNQLTFLQKLQKILEEAINQRCDRNLYTFLCQAVKKLSSHATDFYHIHLETFSETIGISRLRPLKENEFYYIDATRNIIPKGKFESSYVQLTQIGFNVLSPTPGNPADQQARAAREQFNAVKSSSPLKNKKASRKNETPKNIDPLHWFDLTPKFQ